MNIFKQAFAYIQSTKAYDVLFYNNPDDERKTWGKTDLLKANEISLYTNRAIAKRAEKVSEIQFYLTDRKSQKRIDSHKILDLLNKPNSFQTALQFWGLYQKYRDLVGEAYIWKIPSEEFGNNTGELVLLRPDCITHKYDDQGRITAFVHTSPMGGQTVELSPSEVIYLYTPDPLKPMQGISLIKAGIRAIDTEQQLSQYHANVIRNGGNVSNVIKFKTPNLTKQQVNELKEQYTEQYASARNGGKPLFLAGDAEVIKLGMSPDELSYLESKGMVLDEIIIMTGVPKAILGLTEGETFANADASIQIFLRETIKPIMTDLCTILDWQLVPEQFDLNFVDPTPENVELKLKRMETGVKTGYMTINEARELDGLDPIQGADTLLVPNTVRPLEQALKEPEPNPNVKPNDPEGKGAAEHPLRDPAVRDAYGKLMIKRMDRAEAKVLDAMQEYFSGQRRRLIEYLEGHPRKRKDLLEDGFNHQLEIDLAKQTILPLIRDILKRAGMEAKELAGSSFPFVLSQRIESFLDQRSGVFANSINETTFEKLKSEFKASLEAGESRQDLVKRIRGVYEGYDETRARTIARTEVHGATQTGTFEGYKQAGIKTKIWVAVGDAQTRDAHLAADGQEVPFDMPFNVGGEALMYPSDPHGSAENTVNCRCSI
ncbi:MAG: phage portal protein [Desulfurellales bacterium]|nr:MAG: phage portal protein [Desulfurellales bacterium]